MRDTIPKQSGQVFGAVVASLINALRKASDKLRREILAREAAAQLRALGDYELKDIGVSRSEIDYKTRHPHE